MVNALEEELEDGEGLPEMCFSTLPDSGALICIKRGGNCGGWKAVRGHPICFSSTIWRSGW